MAFWERPIQHSNFGMDQTSTAVNRVRMGLDMNEASLKNGRGGEIRTLDLVVPNDAR